MNGARPERPTHSEHSAPPERSEIWFARHGATEWSENGRHTSRTDLPLTEAGKAAARALAPRLSSRTFAAVWSSPLERARQTAALAGFPDAELDSDLAEWDYGEYEGLTTAQIRERAPGWTVFSGECPGGETAGEVAERIGRVVARADSAGGDVLLFAHGHVLRTLTGVLLEGDPRAGARYALATATINVVGWERETRVLRRWNA